ncbi:M24 family metallopeptidase [Natronobacterium gregoryi]|uniref:Peptidase n=2 Tax=Natronobacterium gregoryi TaxID=44930 RepID=L0AEV5_NATGS|nr:M24 family metallopeptidase [Natronobacterium gregoryi]AFZ71647.1 Xaa-Pro aminopeptidase [Natronobacterium gregoryi SP2]ELY66266.1 peptidase M24 [Natronobacterium gregoryi SP2]PLK18751.1 peptidase [Natronobacterium gregoryi SP2]SFJ65312.1 Xaa-Pro aminopeptidase [Natronobacterium gregoryi]
MEKRERLESYLEENGLDSVWFARPNSFAWLTGGSNVVDRESDSGVAAIGYDGGFRLLATNVELERIVDEELPDLEDEEISTERFPWQESSLGGALADHVDGRAATDIDTPGTETVDPTRLRQPLTERDRERYRELGRETAAAVEAVCRELQSGDTEHEVASALRVALSAREIEAPVVLVGGAERAQQYRHYTPKRTELGDYALVSVTAQRNGLHASCTRTVAFDPPAWLEERHEAAATVEATALVATQEAATGEKQGTAGDVFEAIQDAYEVVGHAGEWERHHQGGAAGFDGREWVATPDRETSVEIPMAYAWNPTVQGAKSEDTVLVTAEGFEVLTASDRWPTTTVEAVGEDRPLELERPGVLELEE